MSRNGRAEVIERDSILDPASFREPIRLEERVLASIWAEALGIDRVGLSDDFFDLGGDSLSAIAVMAAVQREFGATVPTHRLVDASTIESMLRELDQMSNGMNPRTAASEDLFFTLRKEGDRPPVVLIPPRDDSAMRFRALSHEICVENPVGAVVHQPRDSLSLMVTDQLQAMFREFGPRPMHLVGICWGSLVALEAANQSARAGIPPASTVLLDPPPLLRRSDRLSSYFRNELLPWGGLLGGRLAILRQQLREAPADQWGLVLREKIHAAYRTLVRPNGLSDLELEVRGDERFQQLTRMGLEYQPIKPPGQVDLILTRDRPSSASRRARQSWISTLDAASSVHWVSGWATGDVLLHHLSEFGQVVNRIIGHIPQGDIAE